jgi:hypothetical protein
MLFESYEKGQHMRGREQHVERKIRLWVVQQERNRLLETQTQRFDASSNERADQRRPDTNARAPERWRLG